MSIHPTLAPYLASFAPANSEVHKLAEQAEATELDWRDSHLAMVEHFGQQEPATQPAPLELTPIEQDEETRKLIRAGFAPHPSRRSSDRAEANDWALSRAATDNAHRNEVNGVTTDNLGLRS